MEENMETNIMDNLYRIREALDFQLKFAEMAGVSIIHIDREDGHLLRKLLEEKIERMKGGEQ